MRVRIIERYYIGDLSGVPEGTPRYSINHDGGSNELKVGATLELSEAVGAYLVGLGYAETVTD